MTTLTEVSAKITEITATTEQIFMANNSQGYEKLDNAMRNLEALAREAFQEKLKTYYEPIVDKLEAGTPLTKSEYELVKLLIVGEAKYYIEHENDLENWKNETKRLLSEMQNIQADTLDDMDKLLYLRALCHDAMRVVPDLAYYHRERERVERFKQSTQNTIDTAQGKVLAGLINEMMLSDKF